MPTNITIRNVLPADLETLLQISRDTFYTAFEAQNNPDDFELYTSNAFTLQKIGAELAHPESAFYFALAKNTPIGYFKLNYGKAQTETQTEPSLEVERIYVNRKYQGKKIGKMMLNFAFEMAIQSKLKYVWLGVWESNTGAIRFYQRNGFAIFANHVFMFGNHPQTDVLMKKELAD